MVCHGMYIVNMSYLKQKVGPKHVARIPVSRTCNLGTARDGKLKGPKGILWIFVMLDLVKILKPS